MRNGMSVIDKVVSHAVEESKQYRLGDLLPCILLKGFQILVGVLLLGNKLFRHLKSR